MMLTPNERLKKAMNSETVDRPPCICPGGMMNMVTAELIEEVGVPFPEAHSDAGMMASLASAVYEKGCFENYGVPFCMTIEAEDMGAKVDMGSNIYEPHVIEYPLESVNDWAGLTSINFESGRARVVLDALEILKAKGNDVPIIGNLTGPMSIASSLMEPVVFYKQLRKNNKEAHEMVGFVTDQLIKFAKKQIEAGATIIAISDPSGTGEILGPKLFEEFVVKYINKILAEIKLEHPEVGTIVHICGRMTNVYPEVNKITSDVLSFDSMVSMKDARKNLKDRQLMGNVSTYTIEFGDPDKVARLTKSCVNMGSNIISPACGLGMKSPLKNIQSILQALSRGMLVMSKIAIKNRNIIINHHGASSGDLMEVLSENEIFIDNACNGKGSCGKCKIRVVEGQLPEISETERRLLKKDEIESGVRLACLVTPEEDCH